MYRPVRSPKVSDAIVRQIEELILTGVLKPGDQLPAERDLARSMDVSRSSLRDGLVKLEARGLLQVRPGTGTCVCDILGPTLIDPLVHLLKDRPAAMLDLLVVRQALEEIAVSYAAERATEPDLKILQSRFAALNDPSERSDALHESGAVAAYYLAVADASHNVALMHVMRGLFNLMRTAIGKLLEALQFASNAYDRVHELRQRVHAAILARQPGTAREACRSLIHFLNESLRDRQGVILGAETDSPGTPFVPVSRDQVKPTRLSDSVVAQLERLIVTGRLKPGSRLPPESDLAGAFEVSRVVLRDAIVKLEARGLLQARRGEGLFVCDVSGPTITEPLVYLLEDYPEAVFDFLELRRSLEELSALLAAERATEEDLRELERHVLRIEQAVDKPDPYHDAEFLSGFHVALAEASHNLPLVYVMRGLFNLLHTSIRTNLHKLHAEPDNYEKVSAHHRAIYAAVSAHDPAGASQAARVHIAFVNRSLHNLELERKRLEHARLRYQTFESERAED